MQLNLMTESSTRVRYCRKSGMDGAEAYSFEDLFTRDTGEKAFLLGSGGSLVPMVVITRVCRSTEKLKGRDSLAHLIRATHIKVSWFIINSIKGIGLTIKSKEKEKKN